MHHNMQAMTAIAASSTNHGSSFTGAIEGAIDEQQFASMINSARKNVKEDLELDTQHMHTQELDGVTPIGLQNFSQA